MRTSNFTASLVAIVATGAAIVVASFLGSAGSDVVVGGPVERDAQGAPGRAGEPDRGAAASSVPDETAEPPELASSPSYAPTEAGGRPLDRREVTDDDGESSRITVVGATRLYDGEPWQYWVLELSKEGRTAAAAHALEALETNEPRAIAALIEAARSVDDGPTILALADALARGGERSERAILSEYRACPDALAGHRWVLIRALGAMQHPSDARAAFLDELRRVADVRGMRHAAGVYWGRQAIGADASDGVLLDHLTSEDAMLRLAATQLLGERHGYGRLPTAVSAPLRRAHESETDAVVEQVMKSVLGSVDRSDHAAARARFQERVASDEVDRAAEQGVPVHTSVHAEIAPGSGSVDSIVSADGPFTVRVQVSGIRLRTLPRDRLEELLSTLGEGGLHAELMEVHDDGSRTPVESPELSVISRRWYHRDASYTLSVRVFVPEPDDATASRVEELMGEVVVPASLSSEQEAEFRTRMRQSLQARLRRGRPGTYVLRLTLTGDVAELGVDEDEPAQADLPFEVAPR